MAVPFGVVVVRVDDDLARQRRDRHSAVVLQWHGDDDDVSGLSRLDGRAGAGVRSELRDERGQCFRPARVADHHVVAVRCGEPRDLAADVPGTDESDGLHVVRSCRVWSAASSAEPAVVADLLLPDYSERRDARALQLRRYKGCDERCSASHCSLTTPRSVAFTPPGTRIRRMTTTAAQTTRTPPKIISMGSRRFSGAALSSPIWRCVSAP